MNIFQFFKIFEDKEYHPRARLEQFKKQKIHKCRYFYNVFINSFIDLLKE